MRLWATGRVPQLEKSSETMSSQVTQGRKIGTENAGGEMKNGCRGLGPEKIPVSCWGGLSSGALAGLSLLNFISSRLECSKQEQQETWAQE